MASRNGLGEEITDARLRRYTRRGGLAEGSWRNGHVTRNPYIKGGGGCEERERRDFATAEQYALETYDVCVRCVFIVPL